MLRSYLRKLSNIAQDWYLGISTRGIVATDKPDSVYYATVGYSETRKWLSYLDLQPSDVFVDVGCGKGRVLCLAALLKVKKVVGVEYSMHLSDIARVNVRRLRNKLSPVEVHTAAAEEFDYSDATALYFFNPFEANILDLVLRKLHACRSGKETRLIFVMESAEQRAVFAEHQWITCKARWASDSGRLVALYHTL